MHVVAGGWRSGEVSKEVVVEKEACREIGGGRRGLTTPIVAIGRA